MLQNLCHFRLFPYSSKKGHLPVWKRTCVHAKVFGLWVYGLMDFLVIAQQVIISFVCLAPPNQHRKWSICCFLWPHNTHIHTLPQPGPPSILSKSPILCFLAPVKAASITSLPPAYVLGGLHALTVGWLYVGYVGLSFLTPCLKTMLLSLPTSEIPSSADRSLGISAFRGLGNKVANKRETILNLIFSVLFFFTCVVYFSLESLFYFVCQLASLGSDLFW